MGKIERRGGFRPGSGRKKGEPTTVVRVPNGVLSDVKALIDSYKAALKASETTYKPLNDSFPVSDSPSSLESFPDVYMSCSVDRLLDSFPSEVFRERHGSISSKRAKARANRKKKNKKR